MDKATLYGSTEEEQCTEKWSSAVERRPVDEYNLQDRGPCRVTILR